MGTSESLSGSESDESHESCVDEEEEEEEEKVHQDDDEEEVEDEADVRFDGDADCEANGFERHKRVSQTSLYLIDKITVEFVLILCFVLCFLKKF